jgi:hypothetical protein
MKAAEVPLHHQPSVQGQEAGAPFIQSGAWGDFISAILTASLTIDGRRAARQSAQGKGGEAFGSASDTSTSKA